MWGLLLLAGLMACEEAYPEVVVVNNTREDILIRNISFNGCRWDVVLAYGEATSPGSCLTGEDRVHFERFVASAYTEPTGKDGDTEPPDTGEPMWFAYQTVKVHKVSYGQFLMVSIELAELEQDFSVPGPYGH